MSNYTTELLRTIYNSELETLQFFIKQVTQSDNAEYIVFLFCKLCELEDELSSYNYSLFFNFFNNLSIDTEEEVIELLSKNSILNRKYDDETFLMLSMSNNNIRFVKKLIPYCVDNINAIDNDGDTILHLTYTLFCEELIQLLLLHGADKNIKNNDGNTILDLLKNNKSSRYNKYIELLEDTLLVTDGCSISCDKYIEKSNVKNTKRIYDLLKSTENFEILEELEFDFNSTDDNGKTLLDHAFEDKNVLITKYLLSKTE